MPNADITTLSLALLMTALNMNSCAMSSTSPVYMSMPALMLSNTPLMIKAVWLLGAYVLRSPNPIASAIGLSRVRSQLHSSSLGIQHYGHPAEEIVTMRHVQSHHFKRE